MMESQKLRRWFFVLVDFLPPPLVLVVFIIPELFFIPLKFLIIWFFSHGHFLIGFFVFVVAKFLGMAVTAFMFSATREKLLMMSWFSRFHDFILFWRSKAHDFVEPYKVHVREIIDFYRSFFKDGLSGSQFSKILRFRRFFKRSK